MISHETIDRIFQAVHIEEVVGDFVKLKKRGANFLGNCPFHSEKTPSFTVSPTKEIYKCFGCGKAGNSVNFIMEHEHLAYPDVLRYLADKYKIPIEETFKPEEAEQKTERDSMYILLGAAQKYYTEQLMQTEEGKAIALTYLKERELNQAVIDSFNLGWSPAGRDVFSQWAIKNGYSKELLIRTGLSVESEKDGRLYDRFHERVIFPIHNVSGKVVGFGGRILKSNEKTAKYINSPETEVYQKSKVLYGLSQGRKVIRQLDECILVEGYVDVLSMFQNGIENVAATSGTSLTEDQLKLLKRFTDNVIFLFDGDKAGQKAALRGLDMALQEGLNVRVVTLPEEDDPDTFARKHKEDEIRDYLKTQSRDFIQFRYDLFKEEVEKDPAKKANLVREIIASIALINDNIKRNLYLQEAARLLNMQEQVLYRELKRIAINRVKEQSHDTDLPAAIDVLAQVEEKLKPGGARPQEQKIIKDLLLYGPREYPGHSTVAHYIYTELNEITWDDERCRKIFEEFTAIIANEEAVPDYNLFTNSEDKELQQFASNLILDPYKLDNGWEKRLDRKVLSPDENYAVEIKSTLNHLKLRKIMAMIHGVDELMNEVTEPEKQDELLAMKHQLNERKKPLASEIGAVVIE